MIFTGAALVTTLSPIAIPLVLVNLSFWYPVSAKFDRIHGHGFHVGENWRNEVAKVALRWGIWPALFAALNYVSP